MVVTACSAKQIIPLYSSGGANKHSHLIHGCLSPHKSDLPSCISVQPFFAGITGVPSTQSDRYTNHLTYDIRSNSLHQAMLVVLKTWANISNQ